MHYTISEMAKLLGVTTHMLRYYEKEGVIQPVVNAENNYRYYAVLDTRRFNLCRMYRSMGFSLEESISMISWKTPDETEHVCTRIEEHVAALEKEQLFLQAKIEYMREYDDMLRNLPEYIGKISVVHIPAMYRLSISENEHHLNNSELQQEKENWLQYMPLTLWVSRIRREMYEHYGDGNLTYDFGLMLSKKWAKQFGIKQSRCTELISGGDYLMTVHKKATREPWGWEDIRFMADFLKSHDIRFWGDGYSTCVASAGSSNDIVNYHCMFLKIYS